MINKMLIRAETQQNEYANFAELLYDIKVDRLVKYFLVVNDEEVEVTPSLAFNMAAFFDEYNQEVCKISGNKSNPS